MALMAQSDTDQQPAADESYGGPAILSRGEMPGTNNGAPVSFRPYIGVAAVYDEGLLPISVTPTGQIPLVNAYGVEANLGAYTYRTWKHTTLGIDYRGNFRHYSTKSYYDGTDQLLSLVLTHRPSKHWVFNLREEAGTYSRNYFLYAPVGLDTNYLTVPQNDIFDNPVIFLATSADVTYHKSARLSFNFGGEGDLIRYRSTALYGMSGATARADMEYRYSRHTTIGLDYRYTHYGYTHNFGDTNFHSIGVNYSTQLTRSLQLSTRIGGARLSSANLEQVVLDPAVAAILGVTEGIQATHSIRYVPDITARLTNTFRRSLFSLTYRNGVVPGNGVYLTSRSQSGTALYSYSGVRHWNFGIDANYSRMDAVVQTLGRYTVYSAGAGITRELHKGLFAVLRFDNRHYDISGSAGFRHSEYRASLGFNFSPGDIPLALW
jgi:hypothetical protein